MKLHAISVALVAAAALSGCIVAGPGYPTRSYVDVDVRPPPDRVVVAPAVRSGYIWAPGYYRWTGREHVWVNGRYMRARRGYHWAPSRWEERNGHYHFNEGHWER